MSSLFLYEKGNSCAVEDVSLAPRSTTMTTDAAPATTSGAQRAAAAAGGANASSAAADASKATTSAAADAQQTFDSRRYVVLDTNALLLSGNGGAGLSRYANIGGGEGENEAEASLPPAVLVTTRAALAEVRDAASREALERTRGTGVCELSLREPEDEDVKAGTRFFGVKGERERDGSANPIWKEEKKLDMLT